MRILSNLIRPEQIIAAAYVMPNVNVEIEHEFQPRTKHPVHGTPYTRGQVVHLYGSHPQKSQHDYTRNAATWEEWGIFINALYRIDADAKIGHYTSLHNFIEQTRDQMERVEKYGLHFPYGAPWLTEYGFNAGTRDYAHDNVDTPLDRDEFALGLGEIDASGD